LYSFLLNLIGFWNQVRLGPKHSNRWWRSLELSRLEFVELSKLEFVGLSRLFKSMMIPLVGKE
jgi:hypothetical protein